MACFSNVCYFIYPINLWHISEMMTTDSGLAFLANCDKLRTVILNDAGDEYDYEDRYFGITGKGIANLLIALPKVNV